MKRNDIILIAVVLLLGIGSILYFNVNKKDGATVEITRDGKLVKELSLKEDITYVITDDHGHENKLIIKDGYASIEEASCPDQVCVYQKEIHYNGEALICLPNKVVVRIVDGEKRELDSVVN